MAAKCPYCGAQIEVLEKESSSHVPPALQIGRMLAASGAAHGTHTCPACGHTVYVRRHPATGELYVLNRADALSIDAARSANLYLNLCDDPFAYFVDRPLPKGRTLTHRIWDALDRKRREAVREENWNVASKLALAKARYLRGVGRPSHAMHAQAMRYQLLDLRARGAMRVRIVAGRDAMTCSRCAEQAGRVLTIDEALQEMPLPMRCDEDSRQVKLADGIGWCRCFYVRWEGPDPSEAELATRSSNSSRLETPSLR